MHETVQIEPNVAHALSREISCPRTVELPKTKTTNLGKLE